MDVIQSTTNSYQVSFSPTDKRVDEIEKWLIAEEKKNGGGFYYNWNNIKSSFDKKELVTISLNNKTIGFVTWRISEENIAGIEIIEVKPTHRKKGVGKKLINELLNFLKTKNIYVVDLQCSPATSELFWKSLGFVEYPEALKDYLFSQGKNKKLFMILIEHLQTSHVEVYDETIELWNEEEYRTSKDTPPKYIWNIEYKQGTRQLIKPIIHPGHYKWRLRWKAKGKTIIDHQVQRFGTKIDFHNFVIINELIFDNMTKI